uniref:RRM domain-containing protein n=1 Tax=Kalanchoe fedtschenkoi TaxID=63787 RepID=A0A7N1A4I5_KALFE
MLSRAVQPEAPTELELRLEKELRSAYEAEMLEEGGAAVDESEEAKSRNGVGEEALKEASCDRSAGEGDYFEKLLEQFTKEQLAALIKEAVGSHPELKERVREIADADPAQRKIFIHGLGWDTTSDKLVAAFGEFGEIEDVKVVVDRVTGNAKGYAFLLFKSRSGAKKALEQPQKRIGARLASYQLASAGHVKQQHSVSSDKQAKYFPQAAAQVGSGVGAWDPAVANQALSALIAAQRAGLRADHLSSGFGSAPVLSNQPGSAVVNSAGYGSRAVAAFANQQAALSGYPNLQLGQDSRNRPSYLLNMNGGPYVGR